MNVSTLAPPWISSRSGLRHTTLSRAVAPRQIHSQLLRACVRSATASHVADSESIVTFLRLKRTSFAPPELLHLHSNGIMRVTSCLLLALILAACQSPFASRASSLAETVQVRIPPEEFVIPAPGHSVSVSFSVTNRGSTAIFVDRCGSEVSAVVDRRYGGAWHQYMGAYCLAVLSSVPLELAPGETVQSQTAIREPGEYRIRIGVRTSLSNATDWEWTPVSNRFTVR